MAQSTFTLATSYTQTSGLQPDRSTPPGFPVYTDSRPTQVAEGELLLPAAGSAILLPIPASWTSVYQVVLFNIDTKGYVQVVTYGATLALPTTYVNPQFRILQPNGGQFCESVYIGTVAATQYNRPLAYTVQAVDSNGISASSAATKLYYYLTGA